MDTILNTGNERIILSQGHVQLSKISLLSDLEDVLVEGNTVTCIIMQALGQHRKKNTYRNSRAGSLLLGCTR